MSCFLLFSFYLCASLPYGTNSFAISVISFFLYCILCHHLILIFSMTVIDDQFITQNLHLQSPVAYLRSRACWVIEYVSDLKWSQKETLPAILQVINSNNYHHYYSILFIIRNELCFAPSLEIYLLYRSFILHQEIFTFPLLH